MFINHKAACRCSHDAYRWMLFVIRVLICGLVTIIHSDVARPIWRGHFFIVLRSLLRQTFHHGIRCSPCATGVGLDIAARILGLPGVLHSGDTAQIGIVTNYSPVAQSR
jgi:hypothetical protein